jgi:hypothetical protein
VNKVFLQVVQGSSMLALVPAQPRIGEEALQQLARRAGLRTGGRQ